VDLGLRLEGLGDPEPGARLQPAKNLGAATVRLALTDPAEFDDEALGWLRLAYEQNTGPAPPRRRPVARPKPELAPLTVVVEAFGLLGRSFCAGPDAPTFRNVHLGLRSTSKDRPSLVTPGHPWQVTEPVPGDAQSARWEVEITVRRGDDGLDFGGPFVRGDRTDRHLGLVWGDVSSDGTFRLIRGSKLKLADVAAALVTEAMRPGSRLVAQIRFTDAQGHLIRPADLAWSVSHAARR
jgi:hypothetical protein